MGSGVSQFMASAESRARYWARSFAGFAEFSRVPPNAAHESLARLQQRGWVSALLTQNVDRLHHKGGSRDVLELHGTTHEVVCMSCGDVSPREPFQRLLARMNPGVAAAVAEMPSRRLPPQRVEAEDGARQQDGVSSPVRSYTYKLHRDTPQTLSRAVVHVEQRSL